MIYKVITLLILTVFNPHHICVVAQRMLIHHKDHPNLEQFRATALNDYPNYSYGGQGLVYDSDHTYVVGFHIGEKPATLAYLVFDTGSSFTWIQHTKCHECMESKSPVATQYNGSTTLHPFSCEERSECPDWEVIPGSNCYKGECTYFTSYGDGTSSSGRVYTETLHPYTDVFVIGAGFKNKCLPSPDSCYQGIAGFGSSSLAMPNQLRKTRWGFCLPPNATIDGSFFLDNSVDLPKNYKSTRLYSEKRYDYYLVSLTTIFLKDFGNITFPYVNSMIVVDTGTMYTHLRGKLLDNLLSSIETTIKKNNNAEPIEPPDYRHELCYAYPFHYEVTINLRDISITLTDPEALRIHYREACCVGFMRTSGYHNTLGSHHFRGYMMVYDTNDPNNMFLNASSSPLSGHDAEVCFSPIV